MWLLCVYSDRELIALRCGNGVALLTNAVRILARANGSERSSKEVRLTEMYYEG